MENDDEEVAIVDDSNEMQIDTTEKVIFSGG